MKQVSIIICLFIFGAISNTSCKKEYSCENCNQENNSPIADAGQNQAIFLPNDSTTLDGSFSSDADGNISSYAWRKISGPSSFLISDPSVVNPFVKRLTAGLYQVELKVTDDGGLSATDTMQIIVSDPLQFNRPPVAVAGEDQQILLPIDFALLNGSASFDPDNNISTYHWTKISGPSTVNIANADSSFTQVNSLAEGIYLFELLVMDAGGLFSKDTLQVTVNNSPLQHAQGNESPDFIITLPLDSVYLSSHLASVISGSFKWTSLSGPSVVNPSFYGSNALAKDLIPGLYSFRFDVNNALGRSTDTIKVLVLNNPQDLNTITFNNLKWRLADEYGSGIIDLDIMTPYQPNLFKTWDQLHPIEIYLKIDTASQWFKVPAVQSGFIFNYDAAKPHIWIARIPQDSTWVGKKSSIKIKLL